MHKTLMATLCLLSLNACASPYGNYAKLSDSDNVQMADDTAKKITALYPPALTHINLSQEAKDAYGIELVKKLRENGYAIESGDSFEVLFSSLGAAQADSSTLPSKSSVLKNSSTTKTAIAIPDSALSMGYIVDQLGEGLYQVTVRMGTKSLSRVYQGSGDGMVPAGAWARKE